MVKKVVIIFFFCYPFLIAGQQYLTYTHGGLTRDYILYLPNNLPKDAPLVFMLHGYSGSAKGIMDYCGMNDLANEYKFAVCYPEGTADNWNNRFWHVGYDFHQNESVDDVDFIISLADYLQKNYNLSKENTFSTGMSNGGDMSYMLACQTSDKFKAVAPVAGCMMKWIFDSCNPKIALPVFAIHGTDDNTTWWNGDIFNVDGWGAYLGVEDAIEFWCLENQTTKFESENLPDLDPNDGSIIISQKYTYGKNNHEVWLYKIEGGGHDWPGAWGNKDINSSVEIWGFFEIVMSNSIAGTNNIVSGNNKLLSVYPNPAIDQITIRLKSHDPLEYNFYSITGSLIMSGKTNQETFKIDLSTLPGGVYVLNIANRNYKILKR